MKYTVIIRCLIVTLCLVSISAQAQYFSSVPNVLTNAQTANAGDVNDNFSALVNNGNAVFNDFEAQITALGSSSVPSGMVLPFNLAACPAGWLTANGTSGTVDMRGRFAKAVTSGVGVVQGDQFIDHNQTVTSSPNVIVNIPVVQAQSGGFATPSGVVFSTVVVGSPTTGRFGAESRPKNVSLRYCQKS